MCRTKEYFCIHTMMELCHIESVQYTKMGNRSYVTAEMDTSAGSVPAGPNLIGEMEPGIIANI